MTTKACCSRTETCSYELPPLDDQAKMDFQGLEEAYKLLTADDPSGRCARLSFFFGPNPTLPERRVTVKDGEDVLLTSDCTAFHVLAFGLPGCCLPDSTCGLSTDESWSTFANAIGDAGKSFFNRPECLSPEALNQRFRDTIVLAGFGRTAGGGTCDYAALSARLAPPP